MKQILFTPLAPMLWGTSYIVATELLPEYGPFTVAFLRSFPVGLLMILIYRHFPKGVWWWRSLVLGTLNIGFFYAMLFIATYRLPGGIVATVGGIQPLLVIMFSWLFLKQRPLPWAIVAACFGIFGVGLLVLSSAIQLDLIGILAAIVGAISMAAGIVLTKLWGRPAPLLVFTGWQLTAGGIVLIPLVLFFELGNIPLPNSYNLLGFAWLAILNTALGYVLWFGGIEKLQAWKVSLFALLSPVVAVLVGYFILDQSLSLIQIAGMVIIFSSILVAQRLGTAAPALVPISHRLFDHKS